MTDKTVNNLPEQKLLLVLLAAAMLTMLVWAAAYRINNPSLTTHLHRQPSDQTAQAMNQISNLMQKLQDNPADVDTLQQLGQIFMSVQAWDNAVKFWSRLVEIEPENVSARERLAFCMYQSQDYGSAAMQLRKILEIEPDNFFAHYNLGMIYSGPLQDMEKAKQYFTNIINSPEAGPEVKERAKEQLERIGKS